MKKMLFIVIAFLFTLTLFSDQMSLGIAQTVAQSWYSIIYETENTAIANYSIETSKGVQTAFVFNFKQGGFVMTSASNDAEPILAYNDVGGISSDRSPGLVWIISCYNEQVYEIIEDSLYYQQHRDTWADLYNGSYSEDRTEVFIPMDPTWSQGAPYNNFAPLIDGHRCVAGCGPIAMAQMINYYKYLNDYNYSNGLSKPNYVYSTEYPEETSLDIAIDEDSAIYNFKTFEELDNNYLLSVRQIFNSGYSLWGNGGDDDYAALAFACGVALRVDFGVEATGSSGYIGAYAEHIGAKVDSFHRESYQDDWEELLRDEINLNKIIQYRGTDLTLPNTGTHAFILHGYSIDPTSEPCLFFVNWGWGHDPIYGHDGWYLLDNLNPLTNLTFSESQSALINFEPAVFTILGQLSAYFPVSYLVNVNSPVGVDIVAHYGEGTPPFQQIISTDGVYRNVRLGGSYYIQLEEHLPVGTEFWITFESDLYDDVTIYDEITSNSNAHYMEPIELIWKVKPLFNGWNWESFPVLDRTGNGTVDAISVLEEIPGFPGDITAINVLNNGPIGYEEPYYELIYDGFQLLWDPPEDYDLQSTRCFKIQVQPNLPNDYDYRILDMPGTLLDETTTIDLLAGQDNWIGYWIQETQDINDAFGDDWDKVKSIKAEDWEWISMTNERSREDPIPMYYPIRPLNYGKGYVVRVKEDILGFDWHVSGELGTQYSRQTPEDFSYEEKPDYESVIIDSIIGGNNIVEIGVFENDVCVGAAVVDSFPLQILAYTDAVNRGGNLTFQISYGGGRGYQAAESYLVLNLETGNFEPRSIVLGELEHNILRLYVDEEQEIVPVIDTTVLNSNYPNPFNPTTQISFSVPNEAKVNLSIYNIKGQLVKTLINRRIIPGSHIVNWNGKDNNSKQVSSGVYFYKLKTGNKEISKKMLLLK